MDNLSRSLPCADGERAARPLAQPSAAITALTRYGVPIAKAFADGKAAVEWAAQDGERYGCSRIVRATVRGPRTIWRPAQQVAA